MSMITRPAASGAEGGVLLPGGEHQSTAATIETSRGPALGPKLPPKDVMNILTQLKAMLSAGVPLLAALTTLRDNATSLKIRQCIDTLKSAVETGTDLSAAIAEMPRTFDPFIPRMIRTGERSGELEQALGKSAELLDKRIHITGQIRAALAYPAFLLSATVAITIGILVFLVPKFQSLLLSLGNELPSSTRLVLGSSNMLVNHPLVTGSFGVAALVGVLLIFKNKRIRTAAQSFLARTPVVGDLITKAYVSRSVHTLALTTESGVPVVEGLAHARSVSHLPTLDAIWSGAEAAVKDGRTIHSALKDSSLPPALTQMVLAGEMSGSLDDSLRTAASFLDREVDAAMKTFTSLLAPATVLIAGTIVGFVIISLMIPILTMPKNF